MAVTDGAGPDGGWRAASASSLTIVTSHVVTAGMLAHIRNATSRAREVRGGKRPRALLLDVDDIARGGDALLAYTEPAFGSATAQGGLQQGRRQERQRLERATCSNNFLLFRGQPFVC